MNRSLREGKKCNRFERSNGLDTALYKNYLFYLSIIDGHVDNYVEFNIKKYPAMNNMTCL